MRNQAALACVLAIALPYGARAQAPSNTPTVLAETAARTDGITLDPGACYRVRDVAFDRGDLRYYFTDGWVIFAKPIQTAPGIERVLAAVFVRSSEGDDAEVAVLPPSTGERMSLARFTGTPNLNEHLDTVVMLFTDDTAADFQQAIKASGRPEPNREQGLLFESRFNSVVTNLVGSFRLRLIENMVSKRGGRSGFFYAAMVGRKLGNFDALYDPAASRQVFVGQLADTGGRTFYDVWTTFAARAQRNQPPVKPSYEIGDYRIEATLATDLHMDVRTTQSLTVNAPVNVLVLDLSNRMEISSVIVDGEAAEFYTDPSLRSNLIRASEVSQFLVLPSKPIEPGQPHEIRFVYAGNVITQMGKDVYTVGSRSSWYPTNGIQFSRFDITFTFPENLDLVFPGDLKEQSNQEGTKRVRRVIAQPVRVAGFNVGRYESKDVTRPGLTVTVYANRDLEARLRSTEGAILIAPPVSGFPGRPGAAPRRQDMILLPPPPQPDPLARLNPLADEIASAFDYYTQSFGPPALPHLMVSPIPGTFGQGFPGLVYLSTLSYLSANERPEGARGQSSQLFFSETLHAHETAHQWWGNVVTTSSEQDDWLMEALASYSSLMVLEKRKGPRALRDAFQQYRDHLLAPVEDKARESRESDTPEIEPVKRPRESVGPLRLGNRLDNSLAPGAWQAVIYEKGAWVIHMLRRRMGDAAFVAFLKNFVAQHRMQNVTSEEFFAAAAAALPKDALDRKLESFFESWVEGTGIPKLALETKVTGKAPNLKLTVKLTQSEVGERFSTVVPVVVQPAAGKPRTIFLETGPDAVSETISIAARPAKVTLDPDNSVLRR